MSNLKPKIAVGLFGIHHIEKLNHWMEGEYYGHEIAYYQIYRVPL
jgi:hypothetical protein